MFKEQQICKLYSFYPLFFTILTLFFVLQGCKPQKDETEIPQGTKVILDYAKNFELEEFDGFYKLTIKVFNDTANYPVKEFILWKEGSFDKIPQAFKKHTLIKIPVSRIAALSANYYAYLKSIGESSKVVAFGNKDFTSDNELYANIENGTVKEVSNGLTVSEEALYATHPDVVITFATGSAFDMDLSKTEAAGIPVLLLSEWQERTALGRTEWVKIFELLSKGTFEGASNAKDIPKKFNLYTTEKSRYEALRLHVQQKNAPCKKILAGTPSAGFWFSPGSESFTGNLIKDAGGCLVFESTKTELKLDLETAFKSAVFAEIWINPGKASAEELLATEARTALLPAFKNKKIYNYDKIKGKSKAIDFFENGSIYPSKALSDIIAIFDNAALDTLTWYRNIFYN